MRNKYGKIFQNIHTRKFECFLYDPQPNYYDVIQEDSNNGYQQSIFTSSVMLSLMEYFLLKHNTLITEIEFLVEDTDLDKEIDVLLDKMKINGAYWKILRDKLSFLSKYDSIDIKKVNITGAEGTGFLLSLQVNGIIVVSENVYDSVSNEITKIMQEVIA